MKISRYVISLFVMVLVSAGFCDYRIVWSTIDGGGSTSSGGAYQLTGTIGQPDAEYLASDQYELLAGFWGGGPLCLVDLKDFAVFASYWLEGPCNEANNWCSGADLNHQNDVDLADLTILANQWLQLCPFAWPLE
jgi:hypothetical protein